MFNTNPDVNKSNNADDKVEYWVVTQDKWVMEMNPTTFYVLQTLLHIQYCWLGPLSFSDSIEFDDCQVGVSVYQWNVATSFCCLS